VKLRQCPNGWIDLQILDKLMWNQKADQAAADGQRRGVVLGTQRRRATLIQKQRLPPKYISRGDSFGEPIGSDGRPRSRG
jgi:hypothetical protein